MAMIKLKTIDNPLAHCVIGSMTDADEPEFENIQEQLVGVMLQQESDQSLEEGVADGLLSFLSALANGDCVFLDGSHAERAMREAYIIGQAVAFGKKHSKAIIRDVRGGNSGWWWPESLTYRSEIEIYPLPLCEHYGLMLGYKHGRESKAMAAWMESAEGKAQLAEIDRKNEEAATA